MVEHWNMTQDIKQITIWKSTNKIPVNTTYFLTNQKVNTFFNINKTTKFLLYWLFDKPLQ